MLSMISERKPQKNSPPSCPPSSPAPSPANSNHEHNLLEMPAELQKHIVSYRNTRIEHVEEPRLSFGTVWDGSGKTKIAPGFLYPEPGEAETMQNPTGDVDEILLLLDNYIIAILDLFDANAEKSILPPQTPRSPEGVTTTP